MYVKPINKQVRGVYVPENYNGTTFTEPAPAKEPDTVPMQSEQAQPPGAIIEAVAQEAPPRTGLPAGLGGLRSDDLLLLALILLMSRDADQGAQGCGDILPLLALLLFLG